MCTYSIGKPLIEKTQNVASEILNNKTPQQKSSNTNCDLQLILDHLTDGNSNLSQNSSYPVTQATDKVVVQLHLDFRERQERELKFTAAGWSMIVRGSGSKMKMLSLTLMKMIQMYALDEKMWKNLADGHSI
uniref:Uncharacterized protein n=1 Tax=Quercus lobata TaxID=97700 RepID=A0A7N2LMD4_QUELO